MKQGPKKIKSFQPIPNLGKQTCGISSQDAIVWLKFVDQSDKRVGGLEIVHWADGVHQCKPNTD